MANTVTAFYQTLVAAADDASKVLVGTTASLDSVYLDYKPTETSPGIAQVLNVAIPASVTGSVADGGVADVTFTDISFSTKAITFNKHPSYAYVIRDFEQFNSPQDVRNVFLDAALKGILENINAAVTALFTTGNFATNAAVSSTHYPSTTDLLAGYAALAAQKVNVTDPDNMSLLNAPVPFSKILGDSNWTQASIAGEQIAERVRGTGNLVTSFGCQVKMDQQMPVSGTAPTRTFTGIYLHRYAVAVATRPLPRPDAKVVDYTYINLKGIPVRVSIAYSVTKGGYVVVVDAGYGLAVVRPEMGQIYTISE